MTGNASGRNPPDPVDGTGARDHGSLEVGAPTEPDQDPRFAKLVGFWAPRRWFTAGTMDADGLIEEIEEIVCTRGFVAYDGQVITTLNPVGDWEEWFEPSDLNTPLKTPERRYWGPEQADFFGVEQPYQMADEEGPFTWASVSTMIADPYLAPGEMIVGVVHGSRERCPFTCPCHYAQVVYTTRHRLVCMSCGATHVVLREPMLAGFRQTVAPEEWDELFGAEGSRRHEPLDLIVVDIQDIESAAPFTWSTSQWDDAMKEYALRARTTPEEFNRAVRGTELDASIYAEEGWLLAEEPPDPAFQVADDSVDVSMMDSAGRALAAGASAYLAAYVDPGRLTDAIKDLFQSIELLLKVRLEAGNPIGLRDHPNNPTVLTRLSAIGVTFSSEDADTITRLRRLRNDLQHNSAQFNYRQILGLCRSAVIIIDRFVIGELNSWAGDVIHSGDWSRLLEIDEIHAGAVTVAETRLESYRAESEASITACPRCSHKAMLRPHPDAGASCLLCGYIPVATD